MCIRDRSYKYRYYNPESEAAYGRWLALKDWTDLETAEGSNAKTEIYQREVVGALERCFPLITVRRKSTDPPWYNDRIRKKIRQKKGVYKREGRSPKWKRIRKLLEDLVEKRRARYAGSQKDALLASDGSRNFFKNVRNYRSAEKPRPFDVCTLFPGKSEKEVAELLASHFNAISSEFQPLEACQIPRTYWKTLPMLSPYQVAGRIRVFKKPKSMVRGDIFPALFGKFGDLLALPLCSIYNEITRTRVWPILW